MKVKIALFALIFGLLPIGVGFAQNSLPACMSVNSDSDGDGYGWENDASCVVAASVTPQSECEDRGGYPWGWNPTTLNSCRLDEQATTIQPTPDPLTTTACVDTDGDGYGWDGSSSCLVSDSGNNEAGSNISGIGGDSVCVDTDGDGYGWDGSTTCIAPGLVNSRENWACEDTDGDGRIIYSEQKACLAAGVAAADATTLIPVSSNTLPVEFSTRFDGELIKVKVSDDAEFVAFHRPMTSSVDVFNTAVALRTVQIDLYFRNTINNEDQKIATEGAYLDDMTPDGRYILFSSSAANVVSSPNTTGTSQLYPQLYRYDTITQETLLVSQNIFGEASNKGTTGSAEISNDGNTIAYQSSATNLIENSSNESSTAEPPSFPTADPVFIFNVEKMTTVSPTESLLNSREINSREIINFDLKSDGTTLLLATGNFNNEPLMTTLHNLTTGENTELSIDSTSTALSVTYSDNGNYISVGSERINLATGEVDAGIAPLGFPAWITALSPTGRYAAIATGASEPPRNFTSYVFLHDYNTNRTSFISGGRLPEFTRDENFLFFQSVDGRPASNGSTNAWDWYLYELNP